MKILSNNTGCSVEKLSKVKFHSTETAHLSSHDGESKMRLKALRGTFENICTEQSGLMKSSVTLFTKTP